MELKLIDAVNLVQVLGAVKMDKMQFLQDKIAIVKLLRQLNETATAWGDAVKLAREKFDEKEGIAYLNTEGSRVVSVEWQGISEEVFSQIVEGNPDMTAAQFAILMMIV